jgi:hypothetical protein
MGDYDWCFLAAISFVVQIGLLFGVYRMAKVTQDQVLRVVTMITPVIGTIGRFADENTPKLSQIATHASEGAKSLQEQASLIKEVLKDLTDRLRTKVARIDSAVDQTVQHLHQAGDVVKQAICTPMRHVGGIAHGVSAALSVLSRCRHESADHATEVEEMFF